MGEELERGRFEGDVLARLASLERMQEAQTVAMRAMTTAVDSLRDAVTMMRTRQKIVSGIVGGIVSAVVAISAALIRRWRE